MHFSSKIDNEIAKNYCILPAQFVDMVGLIFPARTDVSGCTYLDSKLSGTFQLPT